MVFHLCTVTFRIRFIDEEERATRVRRQVEDQGANNAIQTALERFRNFFNRGKNKDDSDETESLQVSSPLEESSLFEPSFETEDFYYSDDFSSSEGSSVEFFSSKGFSSEPASTTVPPKPAGKDAKELDLNIGLGDGSDIKITVAKRKKFTPNIESYVIRNGRLEPDTTQTAEKASIF